MKVKAGRGQEVFFTSDEHFGHHNIIKYSNRPFQDVEEMDEAIISNFNEIVPKSALTIHGGDFSLKNKREAVNRKYVSRLNGSHIFLMGSHDKWLDNRTAHEIVEIRIHGQLIVVCHYCLRVWAASHYNSWHLYGHSHGRLPPIGKSYDISLDNTGFYPVSYDTIYHIMKDRPDNPNLIKERY